MKKIKGLKLADCTPNLVNKDRLIAILLDIASEVAEERGSKSLKEGKLAEKWFDEISEDIRAI